MRLILASFALLNLCCFQNREGGNEASKQASGDFEAAVISLDDAEKILGQKAQVTDTTGTRSSAYKNFRSTYTAFETDPQSGKKGTLYVMLEEYESEEKANTRYDTVYTANMYHGVKVLGDLGDEAYFHSDNQNFYFVMIRRGSRLFTMKVNRLTSFTSLQEFNRVSRKVAEAM